MEIAQDRIEVAVYLRQHLQEQKIIHLGHARGSMLGVHIIQARPDPFCAKVPSGQVVLLKKQGEVSYPLLLERVREKYNPATVAKLQQAGPPPYLRTGKHRVWVS